MGVTLKPRPAKNIASRRRYFLKSARLYLSDGTYYEGQSPSWQSQDFSGEVVFNTGMTGYVESLTDPSYAGQILVFTYPLIGNYGVHGGWESDKIQVAGVVVSELVQNWSHNLSNLSLLDWLRHQQVPIITDLDTRALTKHIRLHGSMPGLITQKAKRPSKIEVNIPFVSVTRPIIYNRQHTKTIILVDCGTKENIVRSLKQLPIKIKRVPYDYDYTLEDFDGLLLSNGPGDPADYHQTIQILQKAMKQNRPIFGICLGSQIMGLAAGAKTYKLLFGHRGHNQPCLDETSGRAYITSQNHGYAVDEKTLPGSWQVSFRNLNDGSVEGIEHKSQPFFAAQFHPEASPGPTDTNWLFDKFRTYLQC